MIWTYEQSTGYMKYGYCVVGKGYAGKGIHKNNPYSQHINSEGPLPKGKYLIGHGYFHERKKGHVTMELEPIGGQDMFGRGPFLIHRDSTKHPGEASKGCIVISRVVREKIDNSSDRILSVVS